MESKGFFAALFDFSFSEFVTTKIIKVLYGLGVLLAAFGALSLIISGFAKSALAGILTLIVSPLVFLLYLILFRVWLEIVIVIFRVADNVKEIAGQTRQKGEQ